MSSKQNMAYHMELCGEIAEFLDMPTLTRFGGCARGVHWMATRVADDRAHRWFQGVWPVSGWGRGPYWKRLADALQPRRLILTRRGAAPDCTFLVGATLNTKLEWFLEFEMTVAKAGNGTPCLGLIDASVPLPPEQLESGFVPRDMSRRGSTAGEMAVSFSPEWGRVFASSLVQSEPKCYRTATLNWASLGDSTATWNEPLKAGFLIKDRKLTFYRGNMVGQWRSSGVILEDLPDEVIPAVFMSSFVGFARVCLSNLWTSPPDVSCIHCDKLGHGFSSDWCSWPPSSQK